MSTWAKVAAKGPVPDELKGTPDPSLLTTPEDAQPRAPSPGAESADFEADKVAVVDRDEIEKLRQAIDHADEPVDEFAEARKHAQAQRTQAHQAELKREVQAELKHEVDKVEAVTDKAAEKGEQVASEAEKKGKQFAQEAKQKGKEVEKEVKEKWEEGKKDAKEFAGKAEKEIKKDAKKLQRKASEVEKEGRALAKQYPYAASGIVGLVNLALIGVPAYYAYKNWHLPRWDRRLVSAVAVGLTAVFGAESALGWFEYQQEHPRR
ncbi:hypothetical protein JCM10207_000426 [Rhodosporidiobolus poonsookiae]